VILKDRFNLPETENYVKFVSSYQKDHENRFNGKFLETPAMQDNVGKKHCFKIATFSVGMLCTAFIIKYVAKARRGHRATMKVIYVCVNYAEKLHSI
jgi:hypothetical protein